MIPYLETHIVDHCNLKCRGCTHFSPLAEPYFKSIEEFEKDLKRLLVIGGVQIFRIMGGEPLLHPQVIDFCILARKYFPNAHIVLVSNGILLGQLTDEQITKLNEYSIELCISDYNLKIDIEKYNKFSNKSAQGRAKMYNLCLDLDGKQDYKTAFYKCEAVNMQCYYLEKGRIYQCAVIPNIKYFNKYFNQNINYDINDISIDIYTHNQQEIMEFLHTPHQVCKYCNTIKRLTTYKDFEISKKEMSEWIQ